MLSNGALHEELAPLPGARRLRPDLERAYALMSEVRGELGALNDARAAGVLVGLPGLDDCLPGAAPSPAPGTIGRPRDHEAALAAGWAWATGR